MGSAGCSNDASNDTSAFLNSPRQIVYAICSLAGSTEVLAFYLGS